MYFIATLSRNGESIKCSQGNQFRVQGLDSNLFNLPEYQVP